MNYPSATFIGAVLKATLVHWVSKYFRKLIKPFKISSVFYCVKI